MCAGKGAGIGKRKAKAFGFEFEDGEEIYAERFVGCRVIAHCVRESYQGKQKLTVDISEGKFCGYDIIGQERDDAEADPEEPDVGF